MKRVRPSAPYLGDLVPYDPKYLPARIHLNANESPYGLPEPVVEKLAEAMRGQLFHRYPDPLAKNLRARIAELNAVAERNVLLGNGGDELLFNIMLAWGGSGRKLLTAPPSFSSYELDARLTDTTLVEVPRVERMAKDAREGTTKSAADRATEDMINRPIEDVEKTSSSSTCERELGVDEDAIMERVSRGDIDVVMLASPNNPTGDALREEFVLSLLNASDALVLIDQAYIEFADSHFDMTRHLSEHKNLVLLRTFSKAWALAGIRLGYLLASEQVVSELCKVRQPYSVDAFSVLAGSTVLESTAEIGARAMESVAQRTRVATALESFPDVEVFTSEANFILFRVANAHNIWQRLYDERGILLRDFSAARQLTNCLRVSIGTPRENDEFLDAMRMLMETQAVTVALTPPMALSETAAAIAAKETAPSVPAANNPTGETS
jgi:histidinol-phosphate aminotransferase